ncbi:MAG: cobalt-precorrin 5A hydrolase [Lachnospiraceae bacterium]
MNISVISFTRAGQNLSIRIKEILESEDCRMYESALGLAEGETLSISLYSKCRFWQYGAEEFILPWAGDIREFAAQAFERKEPILFIGACGIAVRSIAPYVKDKKSDPPVIVMDEKGKYVIPILSSHLGGGEKLAELLSEILGGQLINTTASDVNQLFAVDTFAKANGLKISDMKKAKDVAAAIVDGKKCVIFISGQDFEVEGALPDEVTVQWVESSALQDEDSGQQEKATIVVISNRTEEIPLQLIPKNVILGVGCKKGKNVQELMAFILCVLDQLKLVPDAVKCMASIDMKKDEQGLLQAAEILNVPFFTFSSEKLENQQLPEECFSESEFVKEVTGVSNVCERAAVAAGADYLMQKKVSYQGMTLAVGIQKGKICFE